MTDKRTAMMFRVMVWMILPVGEPEIKTVDLIALDQYEAMNAAILEIRQSVGGAAAMQASYFATIEKAWKGFSYDAT